MKLLSALSHSISTNGAYRCAPASVRTLPARKPRRGAEGDCPQREPGRVDGGVYQHVTSPCLRVGPAGEGIEGHAATYEQHRLDKGPDAAQEEQATCDP